MNTDIQFNIGQLIQHKLLGYRGVVLKVDRRYSMSDEWYKNTAKTMPPKDRPWYRILVHNANYITYVAQQNLCADHSTDQINHPELGKHFGYFIDGQYLQKDKIS